jgi:proline dehydrogenase
VAGETVDTALAALRDLNAAQISASLDLLGESVANAGEARAARDTYVQLLDRIHASGADANVSVKLTLMGLDIDETSCIDNLRAIFTRAKQHGLFVHRHGRVRIHGQDAGSSAGRSTPSSATPLASCCNPTCGEPRRTWKT